SKHGLIGLPWDVFGIRHVTQGLTHMLDPISGGPARVVERRRLYAHIGTQPEVVAGGKIFELQLATHGFERDGEGRLSHLPGKDGLNAAFRTQVPGADLKVPVLLKGRSEKRKTADVIPVR